MPQEDVWEKEYQNFKFLTGSPEPQMDLTRFLRFLKKKEGVVVKNMRMLDLGCGTGRNTNFLQEIGNDCTGTEISDNALNIAKERAKKKNLKTEFLKHDMGKKFPFKSEEFVLLLDVTSSNSLNEKERQNYLEESFRVLKKNGYFFVKALCKDGDKNAHKLLKLHPGPEKDTYIMKDFGLVERVFSKDDFMKTYAAYFKILNLKKKTSYSLFNGQSYKRNFWLAYLKK